MEANVRAEASPVVSPHLAELSDGDLLAGTRRLVGASNHLLANLLAHLAEVEARGIHRARACSSLYTYCVYELRFSEDAAFRRVSAARLVRRFPSLFDAIASGELHLTAVLMLGPHLTAENVVEVLARAKHRTKREIGQLVRELDPVPDVPARIEPLGPAPANGPQPLRRPTWEMFVRSFNPVRHLNPGERPRDWMSDALSQLGNDSVLLGDASAPSNVVTASCGDVTPSSGELVGLTGVVTGSTGDVRTSASGGTGMGMASQAAPGATSIGDGCGAVTAVHGTALGRDEGGRAVAESRLTNGVAPARLNGPQRYSVQFTTTAEHVELVERAQALLSGSREGASLAQVHLRAMRELVALLEKRKYGVGARPRGSRQSAVAGEGERKEHEPRDEEPGQVNDQGGGGSTGPVGEKSPRWRGRPGRSERSHGVRESEGPGRNEGQSQIEHQAREDEPCEDEEPGQVNDQGERDERTEVDEVGDGENDTTQSGGGGADPGGQKSPRWRGRHVPVAVRREVFARDAGRCGYVDASGTRCRETSWLELHHLRAFAHGGEHSVANLALRCRAHNALAAEDDFGREMVEKKRGSMRHEPFSHAQRGRCEER